ncbi:MAG: copper chaperone PCu(A)C [Burkholderiaceae bacterium]
MTSRFVSVLSIFSVALLVAGAAHGHSYELGNIRIGHPHARPTVAQQPTGGAYLTLENRGSTGDRLLDASSPVAASAQIHSMSMDGDVMRMREVGALDLAPAAKVEMKPGAGYHIMLIGLKQPLQAGDKFPMTLNFEKAGKIEVSVTVDGKEAKEAKPSGHGH